MTQKHDTLIPRERGAQFHVINLSAGETLPLAFTQLVNAEGVDQVLVRITGGCGKIDPSVQAGLPDFFRKGFVGARMVLFSGATASFDDESEYKGFMVTQVPPLVAEKEHCIALGTLPRTDLMTLNKAHGGVQLDSYLTRLDHNYHGIVVCQQNAADVLSWDGDLALYFDWMASLKSIGFKVAIVAMNGGGVTKKEIYGALQRGIPVIAVEGSLRETDVFIEAFRKGEATLTGPDGDPKPVSPELVSIVPINNATALRTALVARGLVK
jgi:hypothetical protein